MSIIKDNIKKITIVLILLLVVSISILIIVNKKGNSIKTYVNNTFSLKYDNTWNINNTNLSSITLKHSNNGIISIDVVDLEEKYKYENINTLIDDLVSGFLEQNKNYSLLGKEATKVTNKSLDGFKLLFEDGDNEALVVITKQSDKLITFIYEANTSYFDILLDSAQSIIYNFELTKEKLKYDTELENIKTVKLTFDGDMDISKTITDEISSNHYTVKYTIPDSFRVHSFNTNYNYYYEKDYDYNKNIVINTNVVPLNIYESINRNGSGVKSDIELLKKSDSYDNIVSEVEKVSDTYIYKVTYDFSDTKKEKVYILIPLDNSHVFRYVVESTNKKISKSLIDSLKVTSKEKYAENITLNYKNNYLVNNMKIILTDYDKYADVTLYTPKKYQELDTNSNLYEYRTFGYGYDEDKDSYKVKVTYSLLERDINNYDYAVNTYNSYKKYHVSKLTSKVYNNRTFNTIDISYELNNEIRYVKKISTKVSDDKKGYMMLLIESKSKISDNLVKELTLFKEQVKKIE